MYPVPLALDDFTVLDQTRRPFDINPMPLLALLYQVLFNKVPSCVSVQSLHIRQLNAVSTGVSNQIVFIDFEASGEIQIGKRQDARVRG
jgi:hypothetical protein